MTTAVAKTASPGAPSLAAPDSKWKEVVYKAFGCEDTVTLTIAMVQKFIAVPSKCGNLPEDRDCINFLMMCKAKQLNPWEGDAFLIGYDSKDDAGNITTKWTQITAHQAFLKRAEPSKSYDGMESGIIVRTKAGEVIDRIGDFFLDDEILLGGWCRVFLRDKTHPVEKRVKVQTFDKQTKIWRENRAGMVCKCAEADALRTAFPTTIGGLYLREEVEVLPPAHEPVSQPKALFPSKVSEKPTSTAVEPEKVYDAPGSTVAPEATSGAPEPEGQPAAAVEAGLAITERDTLVAKIDVWFKKAKPSKVDQVMDATGVEWQDGHKWQDAPLEKLVAVAALI